MQVLTAAKFNKLNSKVYVAQCKFGHGLFAKQNIVAGEKIMTFVGEVIDFEKAISKGSQYEGDPLQIGKDLYMNLEEPGRFVNHSCEPNAGVTNDVELIALQNINAGEEIFFDYSTTMDEDYWEMPCGCGTPSCRKVIKDFKHLSQSLKRKYLELNVVQKFITLQYQTPVTRK